MQCLRRRRGHEGCYLWRWFEYCDWGGWLCRMISWIWSILWYRWGYRHKFWDTAGSWRWVLVVSRRYIHWTVISLLMATDPHKGQLHVYVAAISFFMRESGHLSFEPLHPTQLRKHKTAPTWWLVSLIKLSGLFYGSVGAMVLNPCPST